MFWFLIVSFYTSMGIAWHRFLAFINLYATRQIGKALGDIENIIVGKGQNING